MATRMSSSDSAYAQDTSPMLPEGITSIYLTIYNYYFWVVLLTFNDFVKNKKINK